MQVETTTNLIGDLQDEAIFFMRSKRTTISLPHSLYKWAATKARLESRTFSGVIAELLREEINREKSQRNQEVTKK